MINTRVESRNFLFRTVPDFCRIQSCTVVQIATGVSASKLINTVSYVVYN